jgi:hypothetical protein
MGISTQKTGVTDSPAGAGIAEYLGLQGPLAALLQGCSIVPAGDPWQIKGSLSHTPTLITDTLPPAPVMAWKVPAGKALLFTGGVVHSLAAATEYVRVCRRYFLAGYQATAAPVAPTVSSILGLPANGNFGATVGAAYSYKVAPIDTFRREGPVSAQVGGTLAAGNAGWTVTPSAAAAGVIGYNIYRTLANGSTWYYVGTTPGVTTYSDSQPDSAIDISLTPSNTWTTGAIAGETMDGPGEVIIEVGAVALTGAPNAIFYDGAYGNIRQGQTVVWPTTVGQRIRAKLSGETQNFIPVGTATANAWRGPYTNDIRSRHEEDNGCVAVLGWSANPSAGAFMVFGQQVIGAYSREEAAAAIKAKTIAPINPHGVLIPPLGEIVVEIGALAAGVPSVRDISLHGLLIPTI